MADKKDSATTVETVGVSDSATAAPTAVPEATATKTFKIALKKPCTIAGGVLPIGEILGTVETRPGVDYNFLTDAVRSGIARVQE